MSRGTQVDSAAPIIARTAGRRRDDDASDDAAFARWIHHVVAGVLSGIVVLTLVFGLLFEAQGAESRDAFIISGYMAIWAGVFVGGTAGAMTYAFRFDHH